MRGEGVGCLILVCVWFRFDFYDTHNAILRSYFEKGLGFECFQLRRSFPLHLAQIGQAIRFEDKEYIR